MAAKETADYKIVLIDKKKLIDYMVGVQHWRHRRQQLLSTH